MSTPDPSQGGQPLSHCRTKLERVRRERGVQQQQLAKLCGIHPRTLRRLERGEITSPRLGWLVNICIALGDVALDDVIDDCWLVWQPGNSGASQRPQSVDPERPPTARARVRLSWRQLKKRRGSEPELRGGASTAALTRRTSE